MAPRDGANGYDTKQLEGYLSEIDQADDQLLELKSEHMLACKAPRSRIKGVMKQARESGLRMEAFRTLVAEHRAERRIDERIAALELDDKADYEAMRLALGDFGTLPLGEAALAKAKPQSEQLDSLSTARPDEEQLSQVGRGTQGG